MDEKLKAIYDGVVEGDNAAVQQRVQEALGAGTSAASILNEALIPAMAEVGRLFEEGEYFVPEMLISARAMKSAMALLKPHLHPGGCQICRNSRDLGTVKGDLHDIGKNLVSLMLEGAGFQVKDLGSDVTPEKYVEAVRETGANDCGHVGAADHHDGQHESHHYRSGRSRPARQGEDHDWRRSCDRQLCQADWRGWLRSGCQPRRGGCQDIGS